MSVVLWALLAVLAVAVLVAVLLLAREVADLKRAAPAPTPPPPPEPPEPEPEPQHQQSERPALAVDPNDPPSWRTYHRKPGRPQRTCTCHPDRPLTEGQRVMWWPIPDSGGGVHVLCEQTVGAIEEGR